MTTFSKQIQNSFKSLGSAYSKSSMWCKILLFIALLLLLVIVFKGLDSKKKKKEGFSPGAHSDQFLFKTGPEVYDDFYSDIYDYLVFNTIKNDYEVGEIINKTTPTDKSKILDIGSGTGHHVAALSAKGLDVIGIDISPSMIAKAKDNFPDYNFEVGDALDGSQFNPSSFTHILCMYFTVYYMKDREAFFSNCFNWLMPGGFFIIHLVDRKNFDPILPPGNPLMYVSPQRYAKQRITSTKVKFTDFSYSANFELDDENDKAKFVEKIKNDDDGKVRKHEHLMYMPDDQVIVDEIISCGFFMESKADLLQCQYEYQYLYIFVKPQ